MSVQHFVSTGDWSPEELDRFLRAAAALKAGRTTARLPGKIFGMLFFNPSLRTRTSFEAGMLHLGGHAIDLNVGNGVWKLETRDGAVMDGEEAEHIVEAVRVLSRYVDALGVRSFPAGADWAVDRTDPVLQAVVRSAAVPVVNLESALWHPCQALADALTWDELGLRAGHRVVLTWAYHPKALPMAVPNSVMLVAAQRGLDLTILRPPEYGLDAALMESARAIAATTGGAVRETDDPAALVGARVVYAKSWGSLSAYGAADEERRLRERYRSWQVTDAWMDRTDDGRFMHCLPVRRNVVVSDSVLDSPRSVVVEQAANRLHAQKALMLKLLAPATPGEPPPADARFERMERRHE